MQENGGERPRDKALWKSMKGVVSKYRRAKITPETIHAGRQEEQTKRYTPSVEQGLTESQVLERIKSGAVNTAVGSPSKTKKEIIYSNIFTYFNLIFFLITVCLCLVRSFRSLTFLPVILTNTLVGIVQELRAKKILDELNILNAPRNTVIREGKKTTIPAENLVLDDIIVFQAGNQIPVDAIVEKGSVLVNESLITGESDSIEKQEGSVLLSGSFIVSGECRARADQVGKDSYVSRLTLQAKTMNGDEDSEMMRALDRLVKMIGILIIPIGIILFSQQYYINGTSVRDSVVTTMAAIIGMIPEGLYLLTSAALVVSVMRLAVQKVLVHNMKCIETLARADVLCVDKTGTITENTMTVKKVLQLPPWTEQPQETKENAAEKSEAEQRALPADMETLAQLELIIGDFAAAMATDNITMKALKEYFKKRSGRRPEQVFPFSSETKYSAAVFGEDQYVLGAPEYVLRDRFDRYAGEIGKYTSQGYRVLVFAKYEGLLDGKALTETADPLGMVMLANPVRENARETFAYFARQGVEVKVISGDNPATVSEIAKEAGIPRAEKYVDASVWSNEKELCEAAENYTVFGRVNPEQKRQLVHALKDRGLTVAMTGDGVNDVLALKDADCSIAMASGSDAAAQVSQLVLLESDFSKMPSVVSEGRRVVNNIERTASLFLVKNIFSLLLSIYSIVLTVNYPLEPSQISLIGMFTIGIPAFLMSQEKNTEQIRGHFLSNVLFKALPGGLTDFLIVSALYIFCLEFEVSARDLSTSSTIVLAIVGLMILYQIASPMTRYHWLIWICMAGGLLYCMIFMNNIFAVTSISKKSFMLLVLFAVLTEPTFRYLSILTRKLSKWYVGRKKAS